MKLAVYITGHGYGHLTRVLEVVRRLYTLTGDVGPGGREFSVHVRAPHAMEDVADAIGRRPESCAPVRLDIGIVQQDALRIHIPATLAWLEHYFGEEGDRAVQEEAQWLRANAIDMALVDLPPRAFDACRLAGVPAVGLGNFGWDWLWGELAREDGRFLRFADKARKAYGTCHLLLRTVMSAGLDAFPRQEPIPLVARISELSRDTIRDRLGLPRGRPIVMLSFGGEGLDQFERPDKTLFERYTVVLASPMSDPGPPFFYISAERARAGGLRYCDLVRGVDALITKPGYSTVAECLANRTPLVWTDRGAFPEAPVVASYIREHLPNEFLPRLDLLQGRWQPAVDALFAREPIFSNEPVNGADVAARRLIAEAVRLGIDPPFDPVA